MHWFIIIAIFAIPPVFELDRFTRRDMRKYERVIRRIERKTNSYFRKNKGLQEDLPFLKIGIANHNDYVIMIGDNNERQRTLCVRKRNRRAKG